MVYNNGNIQNARRGTRRRNSQSTQYGPSMSITVCKGFTQKNEAQPKIYKHNCTIMNHKVTGIFLKSPIICSAHKIHVK